jgi:hypothetical protein
MTRRDVAWPAAGTFVGNLLFPRLAHRMRLTSRLRGRRLLLLIGLDTAYRFAILESIAVMRRASDHWEAAAEALRRELGREPGPEEIRNRVLGLAPGADFP